MGLTGISVKVKPCPFQRASSGLNTRAPLGRLRLHW